MCTFATSTRKDAPPALLVHEFVFFVDLVVVPVPSGHGLAAAERTRDIGLAAGSVSVASAGAAGDFLAGDGGRLADDAAAGAAHQIEMDVIVVRCVGARRQHGVE